MGYLFREMVRYGMDRDLITTGSPDMHKGYYTINVPGTKPRKLSHEEAGAIMARAWDAFVNVDGQFGRTICPLPHAQLDNRVVDRATVENWDQVSCQDRFLQIQHELTAEEQGFLVSLLLHISGGHMETSSLWDMIRSQALLMHSTDNFNDIWLRYKLRDGQSALAKKMFDEAVETGLDYAFSTPIKSITQQSTADERVVVRTTSGETFQARKLITTVPLNVLKEIEFQPALSAKKQEAIKIEHVNHMNKIHADVANPELERWNGMRFPGMLMYGYADGVLPNGDVHLTAFGADERPHFLPERNPEKAVAEFKALHPMDVKRMVSSANKHRSFTIRHAAHANSSYRSSTTGARTPTRKAVQHGGGLATCQSIRTSCRTGMETFSSPRLTGHMAGELLSMAPWNREL